MPIAAAGRKTRQFFTSLTRKRNRPDERKPSKFPKIKNPELRIVLENANISLIKAKKIAEREPGARFHLLALAKAEVQTLFKKNLITAAEKRNAFKKLNALITAKEKRIGREESKKHKLLPNKANRNKN